MADEKDKQEEIDETQPSAEEMPVENGQASAEREALINQLKEAEARVIEYKDGWARSQAEFQNYKKRIERDNELTYASMKGDIIKKVLPALDDLERALQNRPADDAWASGIELIARKMQNILEGEGLKRIDAKGKPFDPNFHEAISHEPADGVESEHVIDVVQNGYMLGDRVIRPALVRVAQ
ncbi:MAG TPA: nucleotide exchange factor GrpE [Anaerolineales bacterium]|nr:nucleotide exchange factor GrpE [Anaerolineales bacterium]HMV95114.1 nucleotide exchange factor GrpE [Anaerolineales bacterium]HMX18301.1 nucleotide exchange factor GrpE [Anaerolineales bacterium]HMX72802.1 nucleotide exchange factor GrpE [Anaerolineales bacterium]HMZ41821.1 nucleotide exchange factor GrpE [Anaerolineales bacterium]